MDTIHPKVYIVLLNWNSWEHTIECLESIFRSDFRNYQIVIVDNCSTDHSVEHILNWTQGRVSCWVAPENPLRRLSHPPFAKIVPCLCYSSQQAIIGGNSAAENLVYQQLPQGLVHPLVLIKTDCNLGFGRGNNVAFSYIDAKGDGDYVWLLNNDTVIESTTLTLMVETAQRHPGIIGSVVKYYAYPEQVQSYGGGHISRITGRTRLETRSRCSNLDFIFGVSMMLDRSTLHNIGGFDENMFMYFEENEYCIRAQKSGVAIAMSEAVVFHKGGGSSSDSYFQWKNVYQGKIYTFVKHFGLGPWVLGTAFMWCINLINPCVGKDKKRASREALHILYQTIIKAWQS